MKDLKQVIVEYSNGDIQRLYASQEEIERIITTRKDIKSCGVIIPDKSNDFSCNNFGWIRNQ